jgi:hypothetical protein
MGKALDPNRSERRAKGLGARQDPWPELFDRLDRLGKLHAIACPESPIHETESQLTPYANLDDTLRGLLSGGVKLLDPQQVRLRQWWRAHRLWSAGEPPKPFELEAGDVFRTAPGNWRDPIRVRVNWPSALFDHLTRSTNASLGAALKSLQALWKKEISLGMTRAAILERELDGMALAVEQEQVQPQFGPLYQFGAQVIELELERGATPQEARDRLHAFLHSDHARSAPANRLSAHLMTALAWSVGHGNDAAVRTSTIRDIELIGAYLPYMDAMVLDRFFVAQLRQKPLRDEIKMFRAQLFSAAELPVLHSYLDGLEADVAPVLRETVADVYGDEWLRPYRAVLADARAREPVSRSGSEGSQQA